MRIGINALSVTNRSGTGYYTQQLLLALGRIDRENDYFLFLPEDSLLTAVARRGRPADEEAVQFGRQLRPLLGQARNFHPQLVSRRNRAGRVLWEQYFLPREIKHLELDVFHSPTGIAPARLSCPSVVTLHDLGFLRFPELFLWLHGRYLRRALPRSARRAAAVMTDSETRRKEVIERLKIPPERVSTVLLGVDEAFRPEAAPQRLEQVRKMHRLPERFILALGTVEPRKNLLVLLEAFNRLAKEESDLCLVLVGRRGWKEEPVFERIESLGLSGRVVWTGFLPREDLPVVYSMALVCAYLSIYEGFGLPVLEAMACGTPVVASDIPVFREWTAGAAVLVPPDDPGQVANQLHRMLNSQETRQRLSESGLRLASELTWERTAHAALEVYHQVAELKT